jgi:uncharacterized membrane protein YuzA (DUF378 family)
MEVGRMAKTGTTEMVAGLLVIIGGLNWGLVGVAGLDAVKLAFGSVPILVTVVYDLVGLSALYVAYTMYLKG